MVPREVPIISPQRVPITVPPPRVPDTVTPPRVMKPRVPIISQEYPIEYSRQRNIVGNNNQQQLKQTYPIIITQLYQDINQVQSKSTPATNHQHWLMNIHEKVKDIQQVIEICLKDNIIRHPRKMTHHDYITNMANGIIDDDAGKEFNYRQLSNNPKHKKIRKQ